MKFTAILLLCGAAASAQTANSVKLDNEFVKASFLTDQPRTKTPLHHHTLNRVMIYLDPMELVLRYQTGEVDHQKWKAGQVAWSPAGGFHTGENLVDHKTRVVEVELKKPPSGKAFVPGARDPLKVNPKNVKLEFENEYVRVLRCTYAANVWEPMHEHTNDRRVTVALSDATFHVKTRGAADRIEAMTAGQSLWSMGPVVHAAQADRAVQLIVIELK